MLGGDCRKKERANDTNREQIRRCPGPESSPCISTQFPLLSPLIIEEEKKKTTGEIEKT